LTDIKRYLHRGKNIIGVYARNSHLDKPGLTGKLFLRSIDGSRELIRTDSSWKVTDCYEKGWDEEDYAETGWQQARVVATMGDKPWRIPSFKLKLPPPAYLRKSFSLRNDIRRASVYASALGLYELRLNGQKISYDKLTPGWSDYRKRVYYNTYDITGNIKKGMNCLGVILADGWYSGYLGWERRREYYGKHPRAIVQLEIEYNDGSYESVISDSTWKAAYGAVQEADLLMGELYDASMDGELREWDTAAFDDATWNRVDVSDNVSSKLQAYPGNPVICVQEIQALKLNEPKPGVYVFDIGQNIAGYVRLKIREPRGTRIVIRHGEEIHSDGTLYTGNLRMARATDVYIAKGSGEEIWEPRFTYHGFRYVELTGCTHPPALDAVTGCVIHSGMDETGTFKTSNGIINSIYENIKRSQRGNFIDIPTDCPQRDERLGWSDNHHFFPIASYNKDVAAFYTKWLIDLNDAQDDDGAYPAIAPKPDLGVGPLYAGAPGWADAGILIPYNLYKRYGDIRVLQMYYTNMVRYIEYLCRNSNQYIRPDYGYGDWLSVGADTPGALIGTAYFARVCGLMSEIARVLGKPNDILKYSDLHKNIKDAFTKVFVTDDGRISGDTQTGYVLAIQFGLLAPESEQNAFQHLISDIESRRYHISTGFLGIPYILHVLTKHKRTDIAYRLLQNETYPSWGYMINNGATTMWERWNSRTPENGFHDPLMNSFNHCSLGAFGDWLYEVPGGIRGQIQKDVDFIIRPETCDNIDSCEASFRSVKGIVRVSWKNQANKLTINVQLPVNARAAVLFSDNVTSPEILSETQKYYHGPDRREPVFYIGSGGYTFQCNIK
jgi:alpha-L-rhamnosidase